MSEVERTPDGRYVIVNGRRWRATDPSIPEPLATELRHALMDARRAVGAARRADDPVAERAARDAVHDAKVALGERGRPWWEPPDDAAAHERAEATERTVTRHRCTGATHEHDTGRMSQEPATDTRQRTGSGVAGDGDGVDVS